MFGLADFVSIFSRLRAQAELIVELRRSNTALARKVDALSAELDAEQQKARRVSTRIAANAGQRWTTGDGTAVPVGAMTDSHLFYGLAKARRGEYPDSYSRRTGVRALEVEALRRLLAVSEKPVAADTDLALQRALSWGK